MKYLLIIVLIFYCFNSSAKNFKKINYIIFNKYTKNELLILLNEENELYKKNPKHQNLLNIKYIESFIADNEGNVNLRIQKLLWIIENCNDTDFLIYTYANYHLSSILNFSNSHEIARYYANISLNTCIKYKIKNILNLTYSLLASINYNTDDYDKAITCYENAFNSDIQNDNLFKASMLNNISLCKMKIGDLNASNSYIYRSLHYLNKIPNKSKSEELFKVIVEGNLGSNFHKLNQLNKAKFHLENEVFYYLNNKVEINNIYRPIQELISIYEKESNSKRVNYFISLVKEISNKSKNQYDINNLNEILYHYYFKKNDLKLIKTYAAFLLKSKGYITDSIQRNANKLNDILYTKEINHLKNQFKTNQKLLNTSLKSKRVTTWFLLVSFSLVSVIFILLYLQRNRRIYKNILIQKQKDELEMNKRIILENEVKQKQEKITSLALNLNLKKETEKAFLEKIKEIKRSKIIDIEDVIKDLQFSVSNLIQIDNKNPLNVQASDEENLKFVNLIKEKHPILNLQEINFCCYFRMNLSSKEIATLNNMTDGTIRVYKTKIKTKIGLNPEQNLSAYLHSLI